MCRYQRPGTDLTSVIFSAWTHDDDARTNVLKFLDHADILCRWRDPNFPLPDEEAFATIKAGIDAMPTGVKMMLNSGESSVVSKTSFMA